MDRFRRVRISQLYFKTMWIFALMLYILIPLQSDAVSLIYKGIVLITFGCFLWLSVIAGKGSRFLVGGKEMVCFVLLVLTILVSLTLGTRKIHFDTQIMGILGFLEMPLAIMLMDCVRYDEENTKFVVRINILIAIVFSILSVSKYAYSGILNNLYLGYSNPNATAIFLLLNQTILMMYSSTFRKLVSKCFVIGLCVYEEYLIYLTGSRTCLIVSLAIIVYYLFGKKIKLPKWIIIVAFIFPIAFLLIYTNLYEKGEYTNLQILGKELFSGREGYFLDQMSLLSGKYVFGDVRQHYFTNMHNGPLAIIASCGVIGYILWFLFYYWTIRRYYSAAKSQLQFIALAAILGMLLHSSAEAALITGGAHYSIIVATFYWILKGNPYEHDVEGEEHQ